MMGFGSGWEWCRCEGKGRMMVGRDFAATESDKRKRLPLVSAAEEC